LQQQNNLSSFTLKKEYYIKEDKEEWVYKKFNIQIFENMMIVVPFSFLELHSQKKSPQIEKSFFNV
jgi:hypothetical protein